LITTSAEGLQAGKTAIKSRSVSVGMVESITLSKNFDQVIVKARLNTDMADLLRKDSVFWVVKPSVGKSGVSGLDTLLSGAYIELKPGMSDTHEDKYTLLTAPPLNSPDVKGLRVLLESRQAARLSAGDPVLFRGFRVGSVESDHFDPVSRQMRYQLFIQAPYQGLVTSNVRFWLESALSVDVSAQGMNVEIGSLDALLNGGISFDTPEGWGPGEAVADNAQYELYSDKRSIQNALYTRHHDFILLFNESIRGLTAGAPVEYRGIRIGTVDKAPYFTPDMRQLKQDDNFIPVLIRIEPDRIKPGLSEKELRDYLFNRKNHKLRGTLKSGNLLTGALFVDFDFFPQAPAWQGPKKMDNYTVIPTATVGLAQIQQKVSQILEKINNLPLEPMVSEMTLSLTSMRNVLDSVNQMTRQKEMQNLPADLQKSLRELDKGLQGVQPGSAAYNNMLNNMQQLEQTLRELQPLLRTLNDKSNALVFGATTQEDPVPGRAKNGKK
ncbi:MAG: intermembrane transport protein PqiB, partial [Enterobacteriaceae bacterium]